MLSKILLTVTVILLGLLWVRHHRQLAQRGQAVARTQNTPNSTPETASPSPPERLNDYRFAAYLFLALMLGTGAYMYYLRWQDDSRLITVVLHREGTAAVTYQVEKRNLQERTFVTADGVRVTVASSERMEVIGL